MKGILTAFSAPPAALRKGLQIAFVYTIFNFLGVILWLPIPITRLPKRISRILGNVAFRYKWFIYTYICTLYFLLPCTMFGLALIPHWIGLAVIGLPFIIIVFSAIILKIVKTKLPKVAEKLPKFLQDLSWLPIWLRSLEPLDAGFKKVKCCKSKKKSDTSSNKSNGSDVEDDDDGGIGPIIPNIIRRLSAINTIAMVPRQSINYAESSSEDEYDTESVKAYRRQSFINMERNLHNNNKYSSQLHPNRQSPSTTMGLKTLEETFDDEEEEEEKRSVDNKSNKSSTTSLSSRNSKNSRTISKRKMNPPFIKINDRKSTLDVKKDEFSDEDDTYEVRF
jgi:hypothetical protein